MADARLPDSKVRLVINDISGVRTAFEDASMGAVALIWAAGALELGFAPGPGGPAERRRRGS